MSQYDELDEEIDRDMGWADRKAGKNRKKQRPPSAWERFVKAWQRARPLWSPFAAVFRGLRRVAFFPLISPLGYTKNFDINGDMIVVKRPWFWRIVDGIFTRLLLTPVILGAFMICVVYLTTHPAPVRASSTPGAFGIYFKRVNVLTLDDQRLAAWYVPPLTVDEMAFDPEATLIQKWPGVVVCHGLGASHDQYLSLTQALHNAGFAVLMLDLRGQGESEGAAVTYGLRERIDVLAGVKYLRELPNMDRTKICVVGHDIGATAVLEAAALDSSITAVVADGMWPKFEDRAHGIFARAFGSDAPAIGWLAPLYTVAFEITLRDRISQVDPETVVQSIHTQPVMLVARTGEGYVPVQDIFALASGIEAKHQVIVAPDTGAVANATVDAQVRDFLLQATGWRGPKAHGVGQIEKLLKNQVK